MFASLHAMKVSCDRVTYSTALSWLQHGSPSINPFEEVDSPNLDFKLVKSHFYESRICTDLEIKRTKSEAKSNKNVYDKGVS